MLITKYTTYCQKYICKPFRLISIRFLFKYTNSISTFVWTTGLEKPTNAMHLTVRKHLSIKLIKSEEMRFTQVFNCPIFECIS